MQDEPVAPQLQQVLLDGASVRAEIVESAGCVGMDLVGSEEETALCDDGLERGAPRHLGLLRALGRLQSGDLLGVAEDGGIQRGLDLHELGQRFLQTRVVLRRAVVLELTLQGFDDLALLVGLAAELSHIDGGGGGGRHGGCGGTNETTTKRMRSNRHTRRRE